LGAFKYEVYFQPNDGSDHGSTTTHEKRIFVNINDSVEVQRETLFHELLHVAFEDCPLIKHPLPDSEDQEEYTIRYISPRIFEYLNDNKWLKEFIFG
jgi:Zn-dependent peptidase ImmA (M78 family)